MILKLKYFHSKLTINISKIQNDLNIHKPPPPSPKIKFLTYPTEFSCSPLDVNLSNKLCSIDFLLDKNLATLKDVSDIFSASILTNKVKL